MLAARQYALKKANIDENITKLAKINVTYFSRSKER